MSRCACCGAPLTAFDARDCGACVAVAYDADAILAALLGADLLAALRAAETIPAPPSAVLS